jgi:hypothetical protein
MSEWETIFEQLLNGGNSGRHNYSAAKKSTAKKALPERQGMSRDEKIQLAVENLPWRLNALEI